jgi:hypothetical protein
MEYPDFLNHIYLLIQLLFEIEYVQLHEIYLNNFVNNYEDVANEHNHDLIEIKYSLYEY